MEGLIFDIQRFSIHDGPGIRTTVFVKGCPLKCLWCHNPESQEPKPEVFFSPDRCIGCGYCVSACEKGCHHLERGERVYVRDECIRCGECARECYAGALEVAGKMMSVEDAITEVEKDRPFYDNSGGGMTISGGEPMMQFEFTRELLKAAKWAGLHNCVETCGFTPFARLAELLPYVDLFLYDIKETDPELHRKFTGVSNELILANLLALDEVGASITLRCPIIPGLNEREEHFQGIARVANRMEHVVEIHVLPYHALGTSKNKRLGKASTLNATDMPEDSKVDEWISAIQELTEVEVRKD